MKETHHIVHTEHTCYRVRPNPDGHMLNGSEGVVIDYRDYDTEEWRGSLFLAPEALKDVAEALADFAMRVKK